MRISELNLKLSHDDLRDALAKHYRTERLEMRIRMSNYTTPSTNSRGVLRKVDASYNDRVELLRTHAAELKETGLKSMAIDEVLSLELKEILPLPPEPPVKEKKKRQWFFGPF